MRLTHLFTKTSKTAPADEVAKNAQLLIRAGYIHKEMAGVYAYLPLGLKVVEKIKQIVREEMEATNSTELIMTSLQRKELWEATGRWDDKVVDVWFKSELKNGTPVGFGWSHEEPITNMMRNYISSYRDLPTSVFQFQTKLRNELRAKSGIMRGREFVMKDMYTYSRSAEENQAIYDGVKIAYERVFDRLGIGDITYETSASGGAFTKYSHEYQTISDAGEDIIYVDRERNVAINEEVYNDQALAELGLEKGDLDKVKAAEVGNIFNIGTEKSEQLGLNFTDEDGIDKPVYLSSYGIGITRLMGVIAEIFSDDKGLVWPENIAPAKVYLVRIGGDEAIKHTDDLYKELIIKNIETIYDDRDVRPGQKFADSELMGIPYRVTVSDRLLENQQYELTDRKTGETQLLTREQLLAKLS
ncbi:prolyl-tRNA synthetase [Candidatus Saccharibacteria bacterium]|nr:prolyl-tRNA synthetase [Candidatus Saccharibacteria bacterium]